MSTFICIYGYSFSVFLLVFPLCTIQSEILHWVLLLYGVASQTAFCVINLWVYLEKVENKRFIIIAVFTAIQAGLFLILKFYFFAEFNDKITESKESNVSAETVSEENNDVSKSDNDGKRF